MPNKVTSFSSRMAGRGNKAQGKSSTVVLLVLCVLFVLCSMTQIWLAGHISLKDHKPKANCPSTMTGPGVPTFKHRDDLGDIAKLEGFTKGLELGVQRAYFSNAMLTRNPKWTEYHLVDVWAPLENYIDYANADQTTQDKIYAEAMERVRPFKSKIHVCRNFTTVCSKKFKEEYFDFIYVDARHDFKGVAMDLRDYWPKLKTGGIIAGHDYITNEESGQNWTVNYDGTIDLTGTVVKGAVDTFAASVCRQVTVSYREGSFNTWAMRK